MGKTLIGPWTIYAVLSPFRKIVTFTSRCPPPSFPPYAQQFIINFRLVVFARKPWNVSIFAGAGPEIEKKNAANNVQFADTGANRCLTIHHMRVGNVWTDKKKTWNIRNPITSRKLISFYVISVCDLSISLMKSFCRTSFRPRTRKKIMWEMNECPFR